MSGIFGIVSKESCVDDLFLGVYYLQHRAQDYCGLGLYDGKRAPQSYAHKGLLKEQFPEKRLSKLNGFFGVGCVSGYRQPVSELSKSGGYILTFDGNIINHLELKENLLRQGISFSGYRSPEEVSDIVLVSKVISSEIDFAFGIRKLVRLIQGDFSIVALTKDGIYAARGWGRKPLILGKKENSFAVSSESISFENTGFEIVRDVEPGEVILIDSNGIKTIDKINLFPIKYGTFEWIYTAYPTSVIDGKSVAEVRMKIGQLLAKKYPIEADLVSPIPNSGRWHSIGYSEESGIPYKEVFSRYDYSERSFTPTSQIERDKIAKTKLVPLRSIINGKKIILIDDSIVRGTQMLNRVKRLKELGAKEVHARIACPPLMDCCKYGKTIKKPEDCVARRMSVEELKEKLGLTSLEYADLEILEKATGLSREELCLECWGLK